MICANCGLFFEAEENKKKWCADCRSLARQKKNFELSRRRHGLTVENYYKMLEAQNKSCAACEMPFLDHSQIIIEHNHKTNKVRGLCCKSCNVLIGNHHEDIVRIEVKIHSLIKIVEYLKRNSDDSETYRF